jgi:hypothetical protein
LHRPPHQLIHAGGDLSPSVDARHVAGKRERSDTLRDEKRCPVAMETQDLGGVGPAFLLRRQADRRDRRKRRLVAMDMP